MLKELLSHSDIIASEGSLDKEITSVTCDSRTVAPGSLFVAVPGTAVDGHRFIGQAVERGASAVLCQTMPEELREGVAYVSVADTALELGRVASLFYGEPSKRLKLVGVTGTNGKTTTATLLYDMFTAMGYKAGLVSTVVYRIGERRVESTHTTPDSIRLNELLRQMADEGCDYCFMEVSSHSVVQHRIEGLHFVGGIFTNITHDHLDYHKTFAAYIAAKKGFFDMLPGEAFALVNGDDRNGSVMVQNTRAKAYRYALKSPADFKCRIVEAIFGGMELDIDGHDVWVRFIGRFNAYNLTAVYGAAVLLGAPREEVLRQLSMLHSVSGRFDYVTSPEGVTAIVDYAHTPDALENVLDTIGEIRKGRSRIITVVGCGGNRDKTKRPEMAVIGLKNSDFLILTSDNPRFEKPEDILEDMRKGITESGMESKGRYVVISDRREAIRMAAAMAEGGRNGEGDIILIAGKGHENYQEIEGVRHHFDDKEEIASLFSE
jgi:UDP-N-acetylmuramoyl-L-alanyl-D-glutamate--2,6-diaminopimelate ligase